MPVVRRRIVFRGWVQGVGFRWRAKQAADAYGAVGWVKNEYDGSVTMEIQGSDAQIDQVLAALRRGTFIRIEDMDVRSVPVEPDARGFYAI